MITIPTSYSSITLEEMKKVRLMNRIDTKYVATEEQLSELLLLAHGDYLVQEIDGNALMPYYTLYYDTPSRDMYLCHINGRSSRQKIRLRRYEGANMEFLEIKRKNNKGRTDKVRIDGNSTDEQKKEFIASNSRYTAAGIIPCIENRFTRITLVNRDLTERLTIDINLRFHNLLTDKVTRLDNIAIIELKRDGRMPSPVTTMLQQLHIHPSGFSKYCIGSALTDASLKQNQLKPRLSRIRKIGTTVAGNASTFFD